MAQSFYIKQLTSSDVTEKLAVSANSLKEFFPVFPPGQHFQILKVLDVDGNTVWDFRLAIRQVGNPKPTIGGCWNQFCRSRGLQKGHTVKFFKERDEATGQFNYKISRLMPQLFYRKQLTSSDVTNELAIAIESLGDFPPFAEGQYFQILRVLDVECNTWWNFGLAVQQIGPYLTTTIGGDWKQFCKSRELEEGQTIQFFKEKDEATGQFNYKISRFYKFF